MSKNSEKAASAATSSASKEAKVNKIASDGVDREALYKEHLTVSGCIRALNAKGYTRGQIADFLGKRYQHVRNVLVEDARKLNS